MGTKHLRNHRLKANEDVWSARRFLTPDTDCARCGRQYGAAEDNVGTVPNLHSEEAGRVEIQLHAAKVLSTSWATEHSTIRFKCHAVEAD